MAADRGVRADGERVLASFGWAIEAGAQLLWREKTPRLGPPLFRQGLAFSVGLTLLPIAIASAGWVAQVWELVWK